MADYAVVIPAYNEQEFLPATLDTLRASMAAVPEYTGEIVVCDNNSTDRTAEIAREHGARVVFELHNQIACARNTGARAAGAPWLVFLDADTQLPAPVLRETLELLATGRFAGGGALPTFDRPLSGMPIYFLRLWTWLSRRFTWACGAYVWCLRQAWEEVGGFDERYYASEEIHFSAAIKRWARAHGLEMRILDGPIISSARKLDWFSIGQLLRWTLTLMLMPWMLRRRRACRMWYERPPE